MVEEPTPTAAPKAPDKFMKGNVIARPDIANAPTPLPMKMLSIVLYNDEADIATMAGSAYCVSNLPTGFVPNSNVACLLLFKAFSDFLY